ncbi:hypothetical protein ElyMa_004760400 [Elysia marginata]|uniref:Uncharacterized protein n=1 Tax=Elysia marginata TaxID=1093978 RepID=A0AAV4IEX7_9GAST|nr:hypothetical protein ElyMa_004760400 [Elysia marginata]
MGCLGSKLNRLRGQQDKPLKSSGDSSSKEDVDFQCMHVPHFLVKTNDLTCSETDFSIIEVPANLALTKRQLFNLIQSWRNMRREQCISRAGVEMFIR